MPDREPLPPLDQWSTPVRRRERNASTLTRAQRGDIVQRIIDARRNGVRPGQAYGWYAPGDDLTQPPRVRRRTDEDDLADAITRDRHASSFLSTILSIPTAAPEPLMPIPVSFGNQQSAVHGYLMDEQQVNLLTRFGNYPSNLPAEVARTGELIAQVLQANERLNGEVASMSRMLVAMEARLARVERNVNPTIAAETVQPSTPSRNEARPAIPPVAGNPVSSGHATPVDVARSVPPGPRGADRSAEAERDDRDTGVAVSTTPVRGGAASGPSPAGVAGGTTAFPAPVGPAVLPATTAGVIVTIDQLRAAITAYTQRFGIERGRVLIMEHGRAATVSTVPPERRATVLAAIQAVSEMPTAATPAAV